MSAKHDRPFFPEMTTEEFFAWPGDGTDTRYDLYEGCPRAMAPARPTHSIIQGNALGVLRDHLRSRGLPCLAAPEAAVLPRGGNNHNVRVPDVVLTCRPPAPGDRVFSEPQVIVEVLSPSNALVTQGNVWSYMTIPSVMEIMLLHSERMAAEILCRESNGEWPETRITVPAAGNVMLSSIGFVAPLVSFYEFTGLPTNGADA